MAYFIEALGMTDDIHYQIKRHHPFVGFMWRTKIIKNMFNFAINKPLIPVYLMIYVMCHGYIFVNSVLKSGVLYPHLSISLIWICKQALFQLSQVLWFILLWLRWIWNAIFDAWLIISYCYTWKCNKEKWAR